MGMDLAFQLADLVPGRYVFKLMVKDEQGLTDEDTVTLLVAEGELIKHGGQGDSI